MDAAASQAALQAAMDGRLRLLKEMAKEVDLRGANDAGGRNSLHATAGNGHLHVCRFLVEESGVDVASRCKKGETAVFIAATEGHPPVLRYLIDRGGDPAMPDARGVTPLHNAVKRGHCEIVRLLLSKGVPIEPVANGWTPLHFALTGGQDETLSILLDHGADPNRPNHNLCSPLMMACALRSLKCLRLLVQAGADVNFTTPYGQTALMDTITLCLPDVDKFKLEIETNPNSPGKALDASLANVIKFLLEAGADPNIPNEHGKTPIMIAAAWGQRALVEILFSWTKPIPSLPDWNVDAIMRTLKLKTKEAVSVEVKERIGDCKAKGNKAFTNEDYLAGSYYYGQAINIDPHDGTLYSNRSLCYLRLGEGQLALNDARRCTLIRPRWAKAWYRQGAALSLLKNYKAAVHAFKEALKCDAGSHEIKNALREAVVAMESSGEQGP
ncbi:hypothetical protein ACP4OV_024363 [Aristida adscensionis]